MFCTFHNNTAEAIHSSAHSFIYFCTRPPSPPAAASAAARAPPNRPQTVFVCWFRCVFICLPVWKPTRRKWTARKYSAKWTDEDDDHDNDDDDDCLQQNAHIIEARTRKWNVIARVLMVHEYSFCFWLQNERCLKTVAFCQEGVCDFVYFLQHLFLWGSFSQTWVYLR